VTCSPRGPEGCHDHGAAAQPQPGQLRVRGLHAECAQPASGRRGRHRDHLQPGPDVVLGILSLLPFSILAGIPAIVLGVLALRDIDASDGALRGRGAAWCAIAMGVVSVLVFVLLFLVL
jgi:hypothetical protein